jgi:hypothetical protein
MKKAYTPEFPKNDWKPLSPPSALRSKNDWACFDSAVAAQSI